MSFWEIPLQTLETVFEYRMMTFFAPAIASAKVLRFFFIILVAFFVMFYTSNLRANLMAKQTDKPINTLEVNLAVFHMRSAFVLNQIELQDLVERGMTLTIPRGSPPDLFIRERSDAYPYNALKLEIYEYKNGNPL